LGTYPAFPKEGKLNKLYFALAAIAILLFGCSRGSAQELSEEDLAATSSAVDSFLETAVAEDSLTETAAAPTATPTKVPPTRTPNPSPTPNLGIEIKDLSERDWGWESAIRMLERDIVVPCDTDPIRICPRESFTELEKYRSMVRVLEETQDFKPSLDAVVGTFLDVEGLLGKEGAFPEWVEPLTERDILNIEELLRQDYLPRRLPGIDVYALEAFLCKPSFQDDAALHLCLTNKVTMAEYLAEGVLLAFGPEVESQLPPYRADMFRDLHSSHPLARWVIAAVDPDQPLYLIEYRADLIDPDAETTRLRWTVLLDAVYQLLGGE